MSGTRPSEEQVAFSAQIESLGGLRGTWAMTGIGFGMAFGSFVAGWVVDNFGPHNGFWGSVAAGVTAVLTVALGQRSLSGEVADTASGRVLQPAE